MEVHSQISTALVGKLHSPHIPQPLLHPYYHKYPDLNHLEPDKQLNPNQTEAGTTDYVTVKHYGYRHLLNDPIMTSQASIAFLCGKVQGLLRSNIPATIKPDGPYHRFLCRLISEAESGLNCSSSKDQDRVLNQIQHLFEPSTANRNLLDEEDAEGPLAKRRKSVPRVTCPLRPTLKKLLQPPKSNATLDTYSRYLSSFDPILIHSCSFPNNPNYLGNGLVTNVRSTFLGDSSLHSPTLIWSPPQSESIYYANVADLEQTPSKFCSFELPTEVRMPLTELGAYYSTTGHIDLVTRSLIRRSEAEPKNASFIRLTAEGNEFSQGDIHSPLLPGYATSVCLSPWISGEWSSAGRFINPNGDHQGFVHLYDVEHSTQAVWSANIGLDTYLDDFRAQNDAHANSAADQILLDFESYQAENPIRLDQLDNNPHYAWLRVNFGSCPGELALCSPKHLLLADTRQPGRNLTASQLFDVSANQPDSKFKHFNPFDRLSCTPTRWIGDVYVLAGMTYSMVVLDKRMPGRCVLHWSHNLLGSPAYIDWSSLSDRRSESDLLPAYLVPMASQYPAELSLVGLNFSPASSAQLVGPSLMAAPLTNLLHRSETNLPSCMYRHDLINQRLQGSMCGLTTLPSSDHDSDADEDNPILRTVSLTSMGDLFSHSWYLKPEHADRKSKQIGPSASEWLSNLSGISMTTQNSTNLEQSNTSAVVEGQLQFRDLGQGHDDLDLAVEASREPDKPLFWSTNEVPFTTALDDNADHVQGSKHLIQDLKTIWDVAGGEHVANFAKYFPAQLQSLDASRIAEEEDRRYKTDCPNAASEERLDRLKTVVHKVLENSLAEESATESEHEEEEISDDDVDLEPNLDLDSSLYAMSEDSSMNLSSPD